MDLYKDIDYKKVFECLKDEPIMCSECDSGFCYALEFRVSQNNIWVGFYCRGCPIITSFRVINDTLCLSDRHVYTDISSDVIGLEEDFGGWGIKV